MLIAKRDAEKRIEDEKIARAKQIEDLKQRELDRLAEERVLLTQGAEAAKAFSLEKQGLSQEDAKRIAGEQAAVDKIKDSTKQQPKEVPTLQATESRLLTRGASEDPAKKVAENTALAVTELRELNRQMMKNNPFNLKIVGGGM
jgi:hypothetical protein